MSDLNVRAECLDRTKTNVCDLVDENPSRSKSMEDLSYNRSLPGSPKVRFQLPSVSNSCNNSSRTHMKTTTTNLLSCRTLYAGSIPDSTAVSIPFSAQNFDSSIEMTLRDFQTYLEQCGCWYNNTIFDAGSKAPLHLDLCCHLGVEVSLQDFILNGELHVVEHRITDWTEEIQVNDSSRTAVLVMMEQNECLEVQTLHTYDDLVPPSLLNASFDHDDGDSATVDMNESCSSYQHDEDDNFYIVNSVDDAIGFVTPLFSDISAEEVYEQVSMPSAISIPSSPPLLCRIGPSEEAVMQTSAESPQPFVHRSSDIHFTENEEASSLICESSVVKLTERSSDDAQCTDNGRIKASYSSFDTDRDVCVPLEPTMSYLRTQELFETMHDENQGASMLEGDAPVDQFTGNTVLREKISILSAAVMYFIVQIIALRFSFFVRSREST